MSSSVGANSYMVLKKWELEVGAPLENPRAILDTATSPISSYSSVSMLSPISLRSMQGHWERSFIASRYMWKALEASPDRKRRVALELSWDAQARGFMMILLMRDLVVDIVKLCAEYDCETMNEAKFWIGFHLSSFQIIKNNFSVASLFIHSDCFTQVASTNGRVASALRT